MLAKNWSAVKLYSESGNHKYMSRVGKQILKVPAGVELSLAGGNLTVKGPKATLARPFKTNIIDIKIDNGEVSFVPKNEENSTKALWGTYASHVRNMIKGVTDGYEKKLELEGVGFKSEVQGTNLKFALGFSHPVIMPIPEGLKVTAEKNLITVSGADKELVGEFSANVRGKKPPEPYKGKGIHYQGEYIRRKQGKKAV